jgi:hypothetical protein
VGTLAHIAGLAGRREHMKVPPAEVQGEGGISSTRHLPRACPSLRPAHTPLPSRGR